MIGYQDVVLKYLERFLCPAVCCNGLAVSSERTTLDDGKSCNTLFINIMKVYRCAIACAADADFKNFFLIHSTLQEIDGNFHEPAFNIEVDGVSVFDSAVADTVFFEVLK